MIFFTKFAQKGCFQSKTETINGAIEFCIFELVSVPNFSLNWQFWFFWPNLPKRDFPVENGKIALVRASMVVTYYIKLFRTGADRRNGILMSLLLLGAETIINFKALNFFYSSDRNVTNFVLNFYGTQIKQIWILGQNKWLIVNVLLQVVSKALLGCRWK